MHDNVELMNRLGELFGSSDTVLRPTDRRRLLPSRPRFRPRGFEVLEYLLQVAVRRTGVLALSSALDYSAWFPRTQPPVNRI